MRQGVGGLRQCGVVGLSPWARISSRSLAARRWRRDRSVDTSWGRWLLTLFAL